jgi:hypothetical protein
LLKKLMEAADYNIMVSNGTATFRQLVSDALTLAPPEKQPRLNEVLHTFKAEKRCARGGDKVQPTHERWRNARWKLDEIIAEWLSEGDVQPGSRGAG